MGGKTHSHGRTTAGWRGPPADRVDRTTTLECKPKPFSESSMAVVIAL